MNHLFRLWIVVPLLALVLLAGYLVSRRNASAAPAAEPLRVPAEFQVSTFAEVDQLANPVALTVDGRGRVFIAETHRMGRAQAGSELTADENAASRTVADRLNLSTKKLGKRAATLPKISERVRRLVDTNGDGRADQSAVFAEGFDRYETTIVGGIVAHGDAVYLACAPDLWRLRDADQSGQADERLALASGFAVHFGLGHDVRGVCVGPDGKLYFAMGDQGLHLERADGTIAQPDTGSVLRMNLDGSNLELFAVGLRNVADLVFDPYGNLFAADNDADPGDVCRWLHIVEGADHGWQAGFSHVENPILGPWISERLWESAWPGQAAYVVPAIGHMENTSGPSGMAMYPGVGFPARYDGHFFLCDYRYSQESSEIQTFAHRERGASFEIVGFEPFITRVLATDAAFGFDGALYVSEWVGQATVPLSDQGRVYRILDPEKSQTPEIAAGRKILEEGWNNQPLEVCLATLAHPDMRLRQGAQFELAHRGEAESLVKTALNSAHLMVRIHAVRALAQLADSRPKALMPLIRLMDDPTLELRIEVARALGEAKLPEAEAALMKGLADANHRVRFSSAMALGKLGSQAAIEPVLAMLVAAGDRDPFLRHAGVMCLARVGNEESLAPYLQHPSPSARMGVLLALRRLKSPRIADYLADADLRLVVEAARAIHDLPIPPALEKLAAMLEGPPQAMAAYRRALDANFMLGDAPAALRLAQAAQRSDVPLSLRVEALRCLAAWPAPGPHDRITGRYRVLAPRDAAAARAAAARVLPGLLIDQEGELLTAAVEAAGNLQVAEARPELVAIADDRGQKAELRAQALQALDQVRGPDLAEVARRAAADRDPRVRAAARSLEIAVDPARTVEIAGEMLASGSRDEQRTALAALTTADDPAASPLLAKWIDRLIAGTVPPDIQLELVEAVEARNDATFHGALARYRAQDAADPTSPYRDVMSGGDAVAGERVFQLYNAGMSCVRCHARWPIPGGRIGPDLSTVGSRLTRREIVESMIAPNAKIAAGYESVVIATGDGRIVTGSLQSEDEVQVTVVTPEGVVVRIPIAEIDERRRGGSPMPEGIVKHLSRRELRDLVEFLASTPGQGLWGKLSRLPGKFAPAGRLEMVRAGLR